MSDIPPVDDGDPGDGPGDDGDPADPVSRADHEAELQRVGTKEARAAAAKAKRDLADTLGVSLDEAATIIAAHRERVETEKSETQKASEAAAAAQAEAATARQELEREKLRNRVTAALLKSDGDAPGCDPSVVDTVAETALGFALASEDDDPVAAAVAETRAKLPMVFTTAGVNGADDGASAGRTPGGGRPPGQTHTTRQKPRTARQKARAMLGTPGEGPGSGRPLWQAPPSS